MARRLARGPSASPTWMARFPVQRLTPARPFAVGLVLGELQRHRWDKPAGVFSGNELGCGSDSIDCAYPVQTGEISCGDNATCAIGTWTVETTITGEPWLGAHQMTQDLVRSEEGSFSTCVIRPIQWPGRVASTIQYPAATGLMPTSVTGKSTAGLASSPESAIRRHREPRIRPRRHV